MSVAANNFTYELLDGGLFDCAISLVPGNIRETFGSVESIDFYSLVGKSFVSRAMASLTLAVRVAFKVRKHKIWFYNISKSNVALYLILRLIFRAEVFVLLLDNNPGGVLDFRRFVRIKCISPHGVVSLRELNIHSNSAVIPGIVSSMSSHRNPENRVFLFSGILSENRLPKELFETFALRPNLKLYITGKVENLEMLEYFTSKYPNIVFLGYLNRADFRKLLSVVSFGLNFRDPLYLENDFNFPSKILEYLRENKIVISTIQYQELKGIKYIYIEPGSIRYNDFFDNVASSNFDYMSYLNNEESVMGITAPFVWSNHLSIVEKNGKKNH